MFIIGQHHMQLQKTYTFHHDRTVHFCFLPQEYFLCPWHKRQLSLNCLTALDLLMIVLMYQQLWDSIRFHSVYSNYEDAFKAENILALNRNKILKYCCHSIAERENSLLNNSLPCPDTQATWICNYFPERTLKKKKTTIFLSLYFHLWLKEQCHRAPGNR